MEQDIFDRIMELPIFRVFLPIYKRYKEVLLYLFFGVLTTVVSIAVYALFTEIVHWNPLTANIISWLLAVTFAYFTNRTWVFAQKPEGFKRIVHQMAVFYGGRIVTLLIEEAILWCGITLLGWNNMLVKTSAQVIIIVLNYIFSKVFIFHK